MNWETRRPSSLDVKFPDFTNQAKLTEVLNYNFGGAHSASPSDDGVVAATYFSIYEHNRKNAADQLSLCEILEAASFINAGVMYFITITAEDNTGCKKVYELEVYKPSKGVQELEKFRLASHGSGEKSVVSTILEKQMSSDVVANPEKFTLWAWGLDGEIGVLHAAIPAHETVISAALTAIAQHNRKEAANLRLLNILEANYVRYEKHVEHFITLTAMDDDTSCEMVYKAKVYINSTLDRKLIEFVAAPRDDGVTDSVSEKSVVSTILEMQKRSDGVENPEKFTYWTWYSNSTLDKKLLEFGPAPRDDGVTSSVSERSWDRDMEGRRDRDRGDSCKRAMDGRSKECDMTHDRDCEQARDQSYDQELNRESGQFFTFDSWIGRPVRIFTPKGA